MIGITYHSMRMHLMQLVVLQYVKGRRKALNKEFERCCTFLAEMMEKYGALVLRDIAVEIQYEPETWCDDAEGKRVRYEAYARRFLKRFAKAA
jgi:hypothetical protein